MPSTERASPEALGNKPPPFSLNEKWFTLPKVRTDHAPPRRQERDEIPQQTPEDVNANEIPLVTKASLTKEQKQILHDQKMNAYGRARLILKKKPILISSPWSISEEGK